MKKILLALCIFCGCKEAAVDLSEQSKQEIIAADLAMNDLAAKEGFNTALLAYADDSVIKPEEGKFAFIGKSALAEHWKGNPGTTKISWAPFRAEAAKSGDIGYTFGNWKFIDGDSTYFGNYFTAWKKDSHGKWKFVVDGGNNTPPPAENFEIPISNPDSSRGFGTGRKKFE